MSPSFSKLDVDNGLFQLYYEACAHSCEVSTTASIQSVLSAGSGRAFLRRSMLHNIARMVGGIRPMLRNVYIYIKKYIVKTGAQTFVTLP